MPRLLAQPQDSNGVPLPHPVTQPPLMLHKACPCEVLGGGGGWKDLNLIPEPSPSLAAALAVPALS